MSRSRDADARRLAALRLATTGVGGPPGSHLDTELAHYRERWRATERIVDQRLTMMLGALGSAIAATIALLSKDKTAAPVEVDSLLGAVWVVLAVIAEGVFLRLIRTRLTIHRNIAAINHIRSAVVAGLPAAERAVLGPVHELDSQLPRAFYLWGSTAMTALVQAGSVVLAVWFLGPGIAEPFPLLAAGLGSATFAVNIGYYWIRCHGRSYPSLQ